MEREYFRSLASSLCRRGGFLLESAAARPLFVYGVPVYWVPVYRVPVYRVSTHMASYRDSYFPQEPPGPQTDFVAWTKSGASFSMLVSPADKINPTQNVDTDRLTREECVALLPWFLKKNREESQ